MLAKFLLRANIRKMNVMHEPSASPKEKLDDPEIRIIRRILKLSVYMNKRARGVIQGASTAAFSMLAGGAALPFDTKLSATFVGVSSIAGLYALASHQRRDSARYALQEMERSHPDIYQACVELSQNLTAEPAVTCETFDKYSQTL